MGADLYIEPMYSENRKKYEAAFDQAVKERDAYKYPGELRRAVQTYAFGGRLSKEEKKVVDKYPEEFALAKKLQDKVNEADTLMYSVGYFRDSYNGSSLMWKLGLSWWGMQHDGKGKAPVGKFISSRGMISVANAKKLRTIVAALPITLKAEDYQGWEEGTTKADVDKYFADKKQRFLDFLDLAIKNKKPITASV